MPSKTPETPHHSLRVPTKLLPQKGCLVACILHTITRSFSAMLWMCLISVHFQRELADTTAKKQPRRAKPFQHKFNGSCHPSPRGRTRLAMGLRWMEANGSSDTTKRSAPCLELRRVGGSCTCIMSFNQMTASRNRCRAVNLQPCIFLF